MYLDSNCNRGVLSTSPWEIGRRSSAGGAYNPKKRAGAVGSIRKTRLVAMDSRGGGDSKWCEEGKKKRSSTLRRHNSSGSGGHYFQCLYIDLKRLSRHMYKVQRPDLLS